MDTLFVISSPCHGLISKCEFGLRCVIRIYPNRSRNINAFSLCTSYVLSGIRIKNAFNLPSFFFPLLALPNNRSHIQLYFVVLYLSLCKADTYNYKIIVWLFRTLSFDNCCSISPPAGSTCSPLSLCYLYQVVGLNCNNCLFFFLSSLVKFYVYKGVCGNLFLL